MNKKLKKLNLGCDHEYKEGWVNLDAHKNLKCDVVHNLNEFPYPFKDDEFDVILLNHVLEHLEDTSRVLKELHRISKEGAIIKIEVPYFNSFNAFRDVTHIRFFTWDSLTPFTGRVSAREKRNTGYLPVLFEYVNRRLIWGGTHNKLLKPICNFMDWIVNFNPDFMERRIPFWLTSESLYIELRVIKKKE